MKLKILLPSEVLLLEEAVTKVTAEAQNGSFCLLEHHIDFVACLVPGILQYEAVEGGRQLVAIHEGTLVKKGEEVLVSVRNAVRGGELGQLKNVVEENFLQHDERERVTRAASAKLEADLIRRFVELNRHV